MTSPPLRDQFKAGEHAYHHLYKKGVVLGLSRNGNGLSVDFGSYGLRNIAAGFLHRDENSAKKAAEKHKRRARQNLNSAPKPARGELVDLSEDKEHVPREELIRDTLPKTGVAFIGGQSGALKSFFAVHLSTCLNTGAQMAGRKIDRAGGVVYVAAEGAGTIEGRVKARRSELPDPSCRLPFMLLSGFGAIDSEAAYRSLEDRLSEAALIFRRDHGVELVAFIVDTVAAAGMIPQDKENDPGAWQKVFDALNPISERLNALAILVHHAGKTASAGLRGSSNIRGGADAVLMLSCDRDEITGETKNHFLSLSKSRDAIEGPIGQVHHRPVVIGYRSDETEVTSLVLDIDTGTKLKNVAMAKDGRASKAFRQAFIEGIGSYGEMQFVHNDRTAPQVKAVRMMNVRDAFDRFYPTSADSDRKRKDTLRKQFKNAFEHALKTRLVISGAWNETEWLWAATGNLAGTFPINDDE